MGIEIAITVAREETRVAVLDGGVVTDLFGDRAKHKDFVGNIYKGKVAKVLKSPPGGGPAVDSKNPDPALRTRPIQGIVILSEFKDSGGEWEGKIYDPRAGKTYRSTMSKQPDGTLKVKGYVGPFSRPVTFTPAP